MYDTNQVTLIGRLVRDPEMSMIASKQVAKFSLAVKKNKTETYFFDVVSWEKTATAVQNYVKKGSLVCCVGHLTQNKWQDSKTQKPRSRVEITATGIQFLSAPKITAQEPEQEKPPNALPDDFTIDVSFDKDVPI